MISRVQNCNTTSTEKLSRLAVSDEGFVFDPSSGDSYLLNQTGLTILRSLQKGTTEDDVVDELARRYDIKTESAERDVTDFVSRLKSIHLL
jgi:PqqD family protein of HPr-rel-A system